MPERIANQLEEIKSCATAMSRLAPNHDVGRISEAIANAAAALIEDPWDERWRVELTRAVLALELALEPVPFH